jgi:peroxiredoxin
MKHLRFIFPAIALILALAGDACALGRRNTLPAPQENHAKQESAASPQEMPARQQGAPAAQDTVRFDTATAKAKVEQYLSLIQYSHTDTILAKVNSLIEAGDDEHTKSFMAYTAYNFFYNSPIMGQEGIAVKIAQEWFLNDRLPWPNEEGKFMLKAFVEFNRQSLIGMEAPELELQDSSGRKISLNSLQAEYTILYFYTDKCSSCQEQTPQLVDFVNSYNDGVLAVYAVYADSNENSWKEYVKENLYIYNPFTFWTDVYDPDFSSGFHMLYNVMKTPQMFLIDKEKRIIGRGLDVDALKQILAQKNRERDEMHSLFEAIFAPAKGNSTEIALTIDLFAQRAIADQETFREIMSGMFLWLNMDEDYTLQEGAAYLAEKYIVNLPDRWTKTYLQQIKETLEAFNKNKLGEKVSNLHLERADNSPVDVFDITNEYKVLYFYRPNCGMCSEVTPKMAQIYSQFKDKLDIEFLTINLGGGYKEWIEYTQQIGAQWENLRGPEGNAEEIYSKFHLANIPAIYLLKDNIVVAKGINEIDLKEILNSITQ